MKAALPIPAPSRALTRMLDEVCREAHGHVIDVDTRFCRQCGLPAEAIDENAA